MRVNTWLLCACLAAPTHWLRAQLSPPDPLGENLFPVELVQKSREAIGLDEEQSAFLRQQTRQYKNRLAELQQKLRKEADALASLSRPDRVEGAALLAQLDNVLRVEREIKRTQLELLVRVKNRLTPEQQAKLREIKQQTPRLQAKMRRLSAITERLRQAGRDVASLEPARKKIEQLLSQKKFKEAESALDRSLEILEKPAKQ